tara:strand:+ start:6593 stop:10051 length:3459 start_codon:yes stop_codon:yes gene_type:complete
MPGFLRGEVPNPNYEREDVNQFSQISEFTNDVYVYGTLYADIFAKDIDFGDEVEFTDLKVKRNFTVLGLSTFVGPVDMDYLTVYQQFNVGAIGTVFVAISSTSDDNGVVGGRVGIGTTQPDNKFQVSAGDTSFNITDLGLVGIGTTQPVEKFQVGLGDNSTVITGLGTVGIGTTSVGGDWTHTNVPGVPGEYDGDTQGELKLDVLGSIHVDRNIYDSQGSPGVNGYYMQRDQNGIRWNQVSPADLDGIRVQDEGTDLPIGGTSQLYSHLNFVQVNSLGTGVDNLVPIPNPQNPTTIANIQTKDFWGHNGNNIYRMSNVGINNNNPTSTLDISGTVHATDAVDFDSTLNVDGATTLNSTLDVDGATTLNSTLDVDGATTLNSTLDVDGDTTLNATLDVDGATTLNSTLDVDGLSTFNDATEATSTTNASVQIDGGVGIVKKLIVGGQTEIQDTTDSGDKDTGALIVEGGVGIEKNLNVGANAVIKGRLDVDDTTNSSSPTSGSAVIDGGVGIGLNLNVGGSGVIEGRLDVNSVQQSDNTSSGAAVIDGGVGIAKNLNVGEDAKIIGDLELEKRIIDFFNEPGVGICKTDYRLSSFDVSGVGIGVSWRPSGVQTKRTIWVTKNGCDTNSGLLEGDAKYTIGAAAAIAQKGDTIRVRSGTYLENNPIGLREDVAVNGEDLRLVLLIPENKNKDFFHVRRGCLIENLSFTGASLADDHTNCGAVAFPPTTAAADDPTINDFRAVTGFTSEDGPADEGSSGRWRSPYIRNCTNFMTKSIGMKINGDYANADALGTNNLGQDLKSMVCDSFTQYNEAGIGVSLSNNAYAQLVSIFTICSDVGIAATSGGQCDLTNSNSSFGNVGLKADGFGIVEFDGFTNTVTAGGADTIISINTQDFNTPTRRFRTPFDGQGAYFHLNMANYPDSPSNISIDKPLELVRGIRVLTGGSLGQYSPAAPPIITLSELPQGPEAIIPEFSPNVSAAGTITSVDVINSGRNFLPGQTLTVNIQGGGGGTDAQLEVDMDPILFTVSEASVTSEVVGLSTITFNEFIPYAITSNVKIEFVRLSRIITSSHSFEYIGAGTDINTANPFQAGKPIPANEVVAINGGQVPFTSTDQKGNFRIGDGLTIDQTTSTIRGRDFNRAIQAQLTPLILALN